MCTGKDGCEGCASGDRPSTYVDAGVVAMFIDHYGWHLYAVELARPDEDYRTYEIEITERCARRALSADEHAHAEQRLRIFLAPHVAAIRAARDT